MQIGNIWNLYEHPGEIIVVIAHVKELKDKAGAEVKQLADRGLNRIFPGRSIKKVLLVAPPDADVTLFDYATAKSGRYWNFPPYGLGIIAAHVRNDGMSVRIINLNNEVLKACKFSGSEKDFDFDNVWKTELSKSIEDFQPDIAGVTCMFTQTHGSAVKVCGEIKKINPTLPVAVGGVHITNCFMDNKASGLLLNDFRSVDMFFLYEAELAFEQFIKAVNRKIPSDELCQVCLNSDIERFYFSRKKIPTEKEIDVIPAHDLMTPTELVNYGVIGSFFCLKEKGSKITTILSNRGCRGQCNYCSVRRFNGAGVRHRSVESIIDELVMLRDKYGIAHVMWLDDDLLHNHERVLRLFNEMTKRNIGITWDCTNGVIASSCTDDIIDAAAKSGCIGLNVGVESGNPAILKRIKKPGDVNTFRRAAEVLRKYEQINSRVFLMIGLPGETYRMLLDTFNLAMDMDLDWYNITVFEPLPNTPVFESMSGDALSNQFKFEDIRYSSGPYGKIREKANGRLFSAVSRDPFKNADLDAVPPRSQLNDIWFYMNYHLNFKRLYNVKSPIKLKQQIKYLQNITDLIAPDDPFPMYFCGYLQKKVTGSVDVQLMERLYERLSSSGYWQEKFSSFGLSVEHLKTGVFPEDAHNHLGKEKYERFAN